MLCFLGSFYLPAQLEDIAYNRYIGNANDLLQKSYIKGLSSLCRNVGGQILALTSPNLPAYPKPGSKLWQPCIACTLYDSKCISLPFLNLPVIKHISRFFYVKKKIFKESAINCVFVYDLDISLLLAACLLKRNRSRIKIVCIVPDLIGFTGGANNLLYRIYNKMLWCIFSYCAPFVDLFVYIAEAMPRYLKLSNPYIVIEGIYNDDCDKQFLPELSIGNEGKKRILYAGAMSHRNGVLNLIKAFRKIEDKGFELVLCGDGELRDEIEAISDVDKRICFMGNLPHTEVLKLERSTDLLVNPRPAIEDFTKYSFPSKTLEYFASATPVMMFRLEGVPDEYYRYCYTFRSFKVEDMKEDILRFFSIPLGERSKKGQDACDFVLSKKNAEKQVKKLFSYLKQLN